MQKQITILLYSPVRKSYFIQSSGPDHLLLSVSEFAIAVASFVGPAVQMVDLLDPGKDVPVGKIGQCKTVQVPLDGHQIAFALSPIRRFKRLDDLIGIRG